MAENRFSENELKERYAHPFLMLLRDERYVPRRKAVKEGAKIPGNRQISVDDETLAQIASGHLIPTLKQVQELALDHKLTVGKDHYVNFLRLGELYHRMNTEPPQEEKRPKNIGAPKEFRSEFAKTLATIRASRYYFLGKAYTEKTANEESLAIDNMESLSTDNMRGMGYTIYSSYETGTRIPSYEVLKEITDALECTDEEKRLLRKHHSLPEGEQMNPTHIQAFERYIKHIKSTGLNPTDIAKKAGYADASPIKLIRLGIALPELFSHFVTALGFASVDNFLAEAAKLPEVAAPDAKASDAGITAHTAPTRGQGASGV